MLNFVAQILETRKRLFLLKVVHRYHGSTDYRQMAAVGNYWGRQTMISDHF